MLVRGLEAEGLAASSAELDRLFADFISYYSEHIADRSRPFPGLAEALDTLAAQNWLFAVCTNKLEHLSVKLLEQLGLAERFAAICGQDTFGVQKPDPEILRRTVTSAGGDPARSIMVGDSLTDVRTARAAGVPVIAVDFGYTESPAASFDADRLVSGFAELPDAVAGLCAQKWREI